MVDASHFQVDVPNCRVDTVTGTPATGAWVSARVSTPCTVGVAPYQETYGALRASAVGFCGTTVVVGAATVPGPTALRACTVKLYGAPLVSPVNDALVVNGPTLTVFAGADASAGAIVAV